MNSISIAVSLSRLFFLVPEIDYLKNWTRKNRRKKRRSYVWLFRASLAFLFRLCFLCQCRFSSKYLLGPISSITNWSLVNLHDRTKISFALSHHAVVYLERRRSLLFLWLWLWPSLSFARAWNSLEWEKSSSCEILFLTHISHFLFDSPNRSEWRGVELMLWFIPERRWTRDSYEDI